MLTVNQASERLGVSQTLVYALCSARKLRHVRVGLGRGRVMIPEEAIEEYLRARMVTAQERRDEPPPPLKHITLPSP
jgi:excisionase family DNA binding protein